MAVTRFAIAEGDAQAERPLRIPGRYFRDGEQRKTWGIEQRALMQRDREPMQILDRRIAAADGQADIIRQRLQSRRGGSCERHGRVAGRDIGGRGAHAGDAEDVRFEAGLPGIAGELLEHCTEQNETEIAVAPTRARREQRIAPAEQADEIRQCPELGGVGLIFGTKGIAGAATMGQ